MSKSLTQFFWHHHQLHQFYIRIPDSPQIHIALQVTKAIPDFWLWCQAKPCPKLPKTMPRIFSPGSFGYDVYYRCVPGLTFEMCQDGWTIVKMIRWSEVGIFSKAHFSGGWGWGEKKTMWSFWHIVTFFFQFCFGCWEICWKVGFLSLAWYMYVLYIHTRICN